MEKSLKLFIDNELGEQLGFPTEEEKIEISAFTADYKRMGNAPTITCTVKHKRCLDNDWTYGVYTEFNGERFYLKQIPSSSFSNKDARYIHELELCSERVQLDNVFVFDVVSPNVTVDRPVSNNTNFSFFGTIEEFAQRLNYSLVYTKLQEVDTNGEYVSGYKVVIDDGIVSEGKLVTIENKVFSEVLQESFNTFEIPYYFVGKDIHLGYAPNPITEVFQYGAQNSLLSIKKENAKTKVINRITGTGSEDNIPYYYPNKTSLGDVYLTYNGAENKAVIGDQAKFSKNNLSSVFIYKHNPAVNAFVVESKKLINDTWIDTGEKYQGMWIGYFEYEVTLNITGDRVGTTTISNNDYFIGGMYQNATLYAILDDNTEKEISKWDVGVRYLKFDENGGLIPALPQVLHTLTKGKYRCVVKVASFSTHISVNDYFETYTSFLATYKEDATEYWTVNNKAIHSLSDYGITTLVEPIDGDTIEIKQNTNTWMIPQTKLMPPIYRETFGAERFYNAKNGTYINPATDDVYTFTNVYVEGNPREHIAEFEEIKPTIVGVTNSDGKLINSFIEFAYDDNDSDEKDEEGKLIHPYFFAKLRKLDGDHGFNLFHHAIESGEMTISMTSGSCGGCQWVIGVDPNNKMNPVQVYEEDVTDKDGTVHLKGSLKRDADGDVLCGRKGVLDIQDIQQDTINNEVWIALMKDEQTFHTVMPNSTNRYKPKADIFDSGEVIERGDEFVILNIHLPHAYITAAEERLEQEIIRYMADNNDEKFKFSIDFSKVYFAEHEDVLADLNENSRLTIKYNNAKILLYVSSFSYSIKENSAYPDIKVELSEDIEISSNAIQQAVTQVEVQLSNKIANLDIQTLAAPYFHRKDISDQTNSTQTFTEGIKIGNEKEYGFSGNGVVTADGFKTKDYEKGFVGASIYKDETGTVGEVDYLNVRKKATFKEVEIQETRHIGGKLELTAAECKCEVVEYIKDTEDNVVAFKVYFRRYSGENELITNKWQVGDQARCDTFNLEQNKDGSLGNRYYWRLVTEVGTGGYALDNKSMAEYHWIVLSNKESETITLDGHTIQGTLGFDNGSSAPLNGDSIIQLGNRFGTTGRVSAIELAGVGTDSPYIRQYENIMSFELGDVDTQIKPGDNKFKGLVSIEDGSYGLGNFSDLPEEVNKAVKIGGENLLRNTGFDGDYESQKMEEFGEIVEEDLVYGQRLEFWKISDKTNVTSVNSSQSVSGYACRMAHVGDWIKQDITLIPDENYVLSFVCQGEVVVHNKQMGVQDEIKHCRVDVKGTEETQVIEFKSASLNTFIWDVKLERGMVQTDWCPAREDNDEMVGEFKDLWYLQHAFKGKTEILGGLILSSLIQLGKYENGKLGDVTAGVNGIVEDANADVAFWGGGTFEQAIKAVNMFKNNPSYQPTQEEVSSIAKAVITHGGRAILNDIVLRGYIYALGGVFNGTVYANDGVFKGDVLAKRNIITRISQEEAEFYTETTTKPSINGSTTTTTKYLVVNNAFITGSGNYLLPDLDNGQMVQITWFNPPYAATYGTTRFRVKNASTAGVGLKTVSTDTLKFSKEIYMTAQKTLYTIIGDRPFDSDFTYWSIIEAGTTINDTDSGVDTNKTESELKPLLPGTGGLQPSE